MIRPLAIAVMLTPIAASAADANPLAVDAKIPLGDVSGRIDHLAFDPTRERLYVAELGNNSVGVVDLKARRVLRTVAGFEEPQGIGYEPSTDTIYVANGGDGSVRLFSGADFAALGNIPLGKDADNVRIDRAAKRVYIGYGDGALAVIDPATRKRIGDIPLKGHPESFQLDPTGDSIFVNVPDAGHIAIVSRDGKQQVAMWPTGSLRANYPLALDMDKGRAISVFRHPAQLQSYDIRSGRALNGIAALEWLYRPTNWPFGPVQRGRCQHLYGGMHRRLLEEAQWKREHEGAERAQAIAKQARDLRKERGWAP